jgi:hypothetical protein
MLKPQDLRIGNLVYDNLGGILKIKGIQEESVLFHINPIPLTEEWLLKMGFYKDEDLSFRWYFDYKDYSVLTYDLDDNCVKIGDSWDFAKATYVHQLQNLTYALTNEELTINN